MERMMEAPEDRFWAKVDQSAGPDGCWPWLASRHGGHEGGEARYGKFGLRGKDVQAHRVAYELTNGPIPTGLQVDHTCHNTLCMNPAHLRLATPGQNTANRDGARRDSRTGIRGVVPSWSRWRAEVKQHGRFAYQATYDRIWDADLAAILARATVFGPNAADRRILASADLLWGEGYELPPRRKRA